MSEWIYDLGKRLPTHIQVKAFEKAIKKEQEHIQELIDND